MYPKLKDYLDLSLEERVVYLRNNGYCYNIEQTAYPPEQLLADFKEKSPIAPQLSIAMAQSTVGGIKLLISYSLYFKESLSNAFAKPKYITDLNHIRFNHRGKNVSFYDCFVNGILEANKKFKAAMGDDVKVRVYCSMELHFLSGLFKQNGVEVYFMRERKEQSNLERADYWRFLACGDPNSDYTFSMNADDENPLRCLDYLKKMQEEQANLFSYNVPIHGNNGIDESFMLGATYLYGNSFGVDNRSAFFKKYKMAELLSAYAALTNVEQKINGIDIYPEFAYLVKESGINIDAYAMNKRCLTEHRGDQCFLNSVIFFGMLNSGEKYVLAYAAPEPEEKLYCHKGFDFNLIRYVESKPNGKVLYI